MKFYLAILVLLAQATWVSARPVPLEIGGDTVVVVKKLPFTITTPEIKGALYDWVHPSTIKSDDGGNVLTITSAPLGETTVQVRVTTALLDKDGKFIGFERKVGKITFVVGALPPGPDPGPPPPDPTPGPVSPLVKALRDAYTQESDPDKSKHLKALAGLYSITAEQVAKQKPSTAGVVWKALEAGALAAGVNGKILKIQTVLQSELKKLPSKSSDVLDDTKRALVISTFQELAEALSKVEAKNGKEAKR